MRIHAFAIALVAAIGASSPASAGQHATVLTLENVIDLARKNPLARAARHNTEAAEARYREARGRLLGRIQLTSFIAPSPDIDCDPTNNCTTTSPNDVRINVDGVYWGVNVSLTQPLFTFGKASAIGDAAHGAARASSSLEDAVAGDQVELGAKAYFGLKLAREIKWMLEDGKEQIEKARKTLEKKLADGTGDVTLQDRFRLETLAAEVDARLTEAREAEAGALAGLRALVGDPAADIDEEALEPVDFDLAGTADGYVAKAQHGDPELRAARLGLESREALTRFERARYLPDFVLVGGVNVARAQGVDDPPSAFANDPFNTTSAYVGLAMRWSLDPLSQPARVERARAEARRASAIVDAASANASFTVKKAHARAFQAKKRLDATRAGEKSARGWVASVLQADAIGAAESKDLADAYIAYFTLRGRVLQTVYDWNLATIGLRRAVGEFTAPRPRH